ncbi:hypothetical protein [Mycobacterium sp. 94-17]|uniref:hypothetical protein n=1 Tax=Mycobacterium sp. 94-17 TaxID=2986147 RepID=UPI002D1E53C8|nr:hypothetical protein [Mycobacterium sp. 94-17]MEB4210976.1 hypothetical protein [Mycobacterium sp. 94-17]
MADPNYGDGGDANPNGMMTSKPKPPEKPLEPPWALVWWSSATRQTNAQFSWHATYADALAAADALEVADFEIIDRRICGTRHHRPVFTDPDVKRVRRTPKAQLHTVGDSGPQRNKA